ncbi:MAG: hypothetical protein WKF59_24670 [Chitinophagaceae bacterium]
MNRAQRPVTKQSKPVIKNQTNKTLTSSKPPGVKNNIDIKKTTVHKKDTVAKKKFLQLNL